MEQIVHQKEAASQEKDTTCHLNSPHIKSQTCTRRDVRIIVSRMPPLFTQWIRCFDKPINQWTSPRSTPNSSSAKALTRSTPRTSLSEIETDMRPGG